MQILGFGFSVCVVVVAFFSWPSAYFVLLLRWSSGYDARFTRERSPVQSRDEVFKEEDFLFPGFCVRCVLMRVVQCPDADSFYVPV